MYDVRFEEFARVARGCEAGGERDVVKPCAGVVTKERETAEAPGGAYVRSTKYDVRFGL